MLAVEHIVAAAAVADLGRVEQPGVKRCCDLAHPVDVQLPLVAATGDFQKLAVDHHFLIGAGTACFHVVLLIFCR